VSEIYDWAMQQPGGRNVAAAAPSAPIETSAEAPVEKAGARTVAAHAIDANIEALLAGVMNWQPKGFFGTQGTAPLSFGSSLLELFSSSRSPL